MNRNSTIQMSVLAAASLALMGVAGCDRSGPAESAGRQIDQSMEKMARKIDQATDRAKEQASRAGQAIDDAADRAKVQASRAGQVIDDAAITAAVKAGILAEPGLKVLKIDVDTKDGNVTLTGSADSSENVQKVTQVAHGVQGVKTVDNRVAVSSKG